MKVAKLVANWIEKQYEKYGENKTVALLSKYVTPSVAQTVVKFLVEKGLSALCTYLAAKYPVVAVLAGPVGTVASKLIAAL